MSGNALISNNAINYGGVLYSYDSTLVVEASGFHDNHASFGGVLQLLAYLSSVTVKASGFHDNSATDSGGVLTSFYHNTFTMEESVFQNNSAYLGGVLFSVDLYIFKIEKCRFYNNNANYGGVLFKNSDFTRSYIEIKASEFTNNSAFVGGVLYSSLNNITIETSVFYNNSAIKGIGGVLYSNYNDYISINTSGFYATEKGGVMYSSNSTIIIILCRSNFTENGSLIGVVIYATDNSKIQQHHYVLIDSNFAARYRYAVIYLSDSEHRGSNVTYSQTMWDH